MYVILYTCVGRGGGDKQHVRGRKAYLIHGEFGNSGCWRGRQKGRSEQDGGGSWTRQRRCALNADESWGRKLRAPVACTEESGSSRRSQRAARRVRMRASLKGGGDSDGQSRCSPHRALGLDKGRQCRLHGRTRAAVVEDTSSSAAAYMSVLQ